jgi:PEP-CTERM motif
MKRTIIVGVVVSAIGLVNPRTVQAQGTMTFLSNLGQTPGGSTSVGSDSWLAALFITGNNTAGYVLGSVQLGMGDAAGDPSSLSVMVYGNAGPGRVSPGVSLASLTGSPDPESAGTYTYIPSSSLTLLPGADYFIVVTAGTTVANGAYEWSYAGANNYNPSGGWTGGGDAGSINGSSWNIPTSGFLQFAIKATAAPEPGVVGLFALGGLLVAFRRRKARPA